jgi:hypothetical protein
LRKIAVWTILNSELKTKAVVAVVVAVVVIGREIESLCRNERG